MPPKSYLVLSPIATDRRYEEGETIELEDHQVAELLSYGAIGAAVADGVQAPLKAAEAIALIKLAASVEDVDTLLGEDTRATVVAAAAARKLVLAG